MNRLLICGTAVCVGLSAWSLPIRQACGQNPPAVFPLPRPTQSPGNAATNQTPPGTLPQRPGSMPRPTAPFPMPSSPPNASPANQGPGNQPFPVAPTVPAPTQPSIPFVAAVPPGSLFTPLDGLSQDEDELYEDLGYVPSHCVPLTPEACFDIGYKCYIRGRYRDALVFAIRGLTLRNDARLLLMKGVCELQLGKCETAEGTAAMYRQAVAQQQLFGLLAARERLNDAMRARFDDIVGYQNAYQGMPPQ